MRWTVPWASTVHWGWMPLSGVRTRVTRLSSAALTLIATRQSQTRTRERIVGVFMRFWTPDGPIYSPSLAPDRNQREMGLLAVLCLERADPNIAVLGGVAVVLQTNRSLGGVVVLADAAM